MGPLVLFAGRHGHLTSVRDRVVGAGLAVTDVSGWRDVRAGLAQAMRAEGQPVVLVATHVDPARKQEAADAGVAVIFELPFEPEAVVAAVLRLNPR